MSYIYDNFPTLDAALEFKRWVDTELGLPVLWFNSNPESDAYNPFPFELTPPILHVYRSDDPTDEFVLELHAVGCGGRYAGT